MPGNPPKPPRLRFPPPSSILGMLPGMGIKGGDLESMVDEGQLKRTEAIVLSMTKEERRNPKLLNPQRKHRIARGAGVDIAVVNRFIIRIKLLHIGELFLPAGKELHRHGHRLFLQAKMLLLRVAGDFAGLAGHRHQIGACGKGGGGKRRLPL